MKPDSAKSPVSYMARIIRGSAPAAKLELAEPAIADAALRSTRYSGRYSCDCLMPCGVKDCPGWVPLKAVAEP